MARDKDVAWKIHGPEIHERFHGLSFTVENTKRAQLKSLEKRTRRNVKFQRAIQGATLETILAKRNQKPEVRKAQREQAIRAAKDKIRQKKEAKKMTKAAQQPVKAKAPTKQKGGRSTGRVGGKR
ncbi:60S ribosomal protein L24-like [Xenia sp. Carnegie-2017]|uniref:60S ribosomal protein L24-like n=1 Tax=Xenia sp. Carnegie-2017 TaxID=2897299 RepID=UPI001F039CEA|nr:60S ribosomal protein L24-like [Xenia sp. Carnegie-2017]